MGAGHTDTPGWYPKTAACESQAAAIRGLLLYLLRPAKKSWSAAELAILNAAAKEVRKI
jgi:hypothetical protein